VVLAKRLGYAFVDSDLVIQEKYGKLLQDLIEEYGTEGFRRLENEVNAGITVEKSVIATGGSAVYGQEAMEHLKEIGTVVYLEVPFSTLEVRLSDIKGRGVVLKDGQTLYDLFMERTPLYEKYADVRVSEEGLGVEETVDLLVSKLQNMNNN
jgi:shikimate kinase